MGEPLTIALVASTAVATAGTLYSGEQQRKAASRNADIQEADARAATQRAEYDADLHREDVRRLVSAQRAAYGKSGVTMEGSPLLTIEDTIEKGGLDALAIRYGGDIAAARSRSAANLSRMQGSAAKTSSYFQAGSSLLAGAGNAYGAGVKANTPTRTLGPLE